MTLTTQSQCAKMRIQKGLGLPFAVQMHKPSGKPNMTLNISNGGIFL